MIVYLGVTELLILFRQCFPHKSKLLFLALLRGGQIPDLPVDLLKLLVQPCKLRFLFRFV